MALDTVPVEVQSESYADPVEQDDVTGLWGFWDETWTQFFGGYATREQAHDACALYAGWLECGDESTRALFRFLMQEPKP
jgi:hypothetical protein